MKIINFNLLFLNNKINIIFTNFQKNKNDKYILFTKLVN